MFCFIVDTNPSMKEVTDTMSALDICKCAVEQFLVKFRTMGYHNVLDKPLLLLRSGSDSSCLLSTVGNPPQEFEQALKNISCSSAEHSLGYTISLALSTINKYRLRDGKENVGRGWMPWAMDQVTIVVLSDGTSALKNPELSLWGHGVQSSELYEGHLRWDYRVYAYLLDSRGNLKESYKDTRLYRLCVESGGCLVVSSGFKLFLNEIKELPARLAFTQSRPFVTINLALVDAQSAEGCPPESGTGGKRGTSDSPDSIPLPPPTATAALFVPHMGEWPLPEAQWLDRQVECLRPRPCRPFLEVVVRRDDDAPSSAFSSDQLQYMVGVARAVGLHIDVYEVSVISINGDSSRVYLHGKAPPLRARKGQANTAAVEIGLFSLDGCTPFEDKKTSGANPAPQNNTITSISNGCLGSRWCGVRVAGSDSANSPQPPICAVLCPSASDPKQKSELLVLPYNFPLLLPLLQQAKDISSHSQLGQSTNLPQKWQASMGAYLRSVPPYYFPSLYKMFAPMGLHVFISLLTGGATASCPSPDISLSRAAQKRISRLVQRVKSELAHLDPPLSTDGAAAGPYGASNFSERGLPVAGGVVPGNAPPAASSDFCVAKTPVLQTSCRNSFLSSAIGKGVAALPIPHLGGALPAPQDLLYTWERTRSFLYGGPGHTVRGVYVAGLYGSSSGARVETDQQRNLDWFYRACGGAQVPRMAVSNMSDYVSVLVRKEGLRDPEIATPPPDEDMPQGVLKRKLSVNFGSPYKLSRRDKTYDGIARLGTESAPFSGDGAPAVPVDEDGLFLLSENAPSIEGLGSKPLVSYPSRILADSAPPSASVGDAPSSGDANGTNYSIPTLKLKRRLPPSSGFPHRKSPSVCQGGVLQPVRTDDGYDNCLSVNRADGETSNSHLLKVRPSSVDCADTILRHSPPASSTALGHVRADEPRAEDSWSEQQDTQDDQKRLAGAISYVTVTTEAGGHSVPPWQDPASSDSFRSSENRTPSGSPVTAQCESGSAKQSFVRSEEAGANGIQSLPEGWVKRFSGSRQCDYWFNTMTGTSQWFPPNS